MNLYTDDAQSFSKSRQYPWKGWEEVVQNIPEEKLKILDLGCGNGRFLQYLHDKEIQQIDTYFAIDNSLPLLQIAKSRAEKLLRDSNFKLINTDLNKNSWHNELQDGKFNLIVAFGITHHLDTLESRENFFNRAHKLLTENGIFIVTFWNFKLLPNWESKIIENLQNENYLLSFGNQRSSRFCHHYSEEEREKLILKNNFQIVKTFNSDGKSSILNTYFILKKNEAKT